MLGTSLHRTVQTDVEQAAFAMLTMAGVKTGAEVGVRTRSSSRSRSSLQQNASSGSSDRQGQEEPVSGNYPNKTRAKRNHDQPGSSREKNEQQYEANDNEDKEPLATESSPEDEESPTNLVVSRNDEPEEKIVCAINPLSIQLASPPESPADSPLSANSGSGGSGPGSGNMPEGGDNRVYMSTSRRIFRPEFKRTVLQAFSNDPECVGNQRATARKFGIHRRQVQKWLQQFASGELTFDDLELQQGDNETSNSESTELTSSNLVQQQRSSQGNQSSRNSGGKVATKRSSGAGNTNRQSGNQQQRANIVNPLDPPSRPTKSSVRSKENKSMPLKGGSKSTAHFAPTIVPPSTAEPSTINLSKNPQTGGSSNSNSTLTYAHYNNNDSKDNVTVTNSTSPRMFVNMSTLLAAAAVGNFNFPFPLDNIRYHSPNGHSPIYNAERGSPGNSSVVSGSPPANHNKVYRVDNGVYIVDELNFIYPTSDFSILKKAVIKEEVTIEKIGPTPLIPGNKFHQSGNGPNRDVNRGRPENRRTTGPFPSPTLNVSPRESYNTPNSFESIPNPYEILRQCQDFLRILREFCSMITLNSDFTNGHNLANSASAVNNGGFPGLFNPFAVVAAAAAAGITGPSSSTGIYGSSSGSSGAASASTSGNSGSASASTKGNSGAAIASTSESFGRRNNIKENATDNHRFISPRAPPAKTVAAALAATRVHPSSSLQTGGRKFPTPMLQQNGRHSQNNQNQKTVQRRKGAANSRQSQSSTRISHQMDDDMIDPSSMVEVVTSIPSPSNSPASRPNQYDYNANQQYSTHNDYQQGMDLTTTSTSAATSSSSSTTTAASSSRYVSKAMSKEYSFLNELGLIRKTPESTATTTTGKNGYGPTHTANLEHFVKNVLPAARQNTSQDVSNPGPSSSPPETDAMITEQLRNKVIETYRGGFGDARTIARTFQLNVRVVMKWINESKIVKNSPTQSNGSSSSCRGRINGGESVDGDSGEEFSDEYITPQLHNGVQNLSTAIYTESNNNSPAIAGPSGGVNKRKNSKPNQICDYPADDDGSFNGALDMVVPIKKRRVSSPDPASDDA